MLGDPTTSAHFLCVLLCSLVSQKAKINGAFHVTCFLAASSSSVFQYEHHHQDAIFYLYVQTIIFGIWTNGKDVDKRIREVSLTKPVVYYLSSEILSCSHKLCLTYSNKKHNRTIKKVLEMVWSSRSFRLDSGQWRSIHLRTHKVGEYINGRRKDQLRCCISVRAHMSLIHTRHELRMTLTRTACSH